MTEKSDLIFVAQVAASFGVKGEFKLLSYTADPLSVLEYNPLYNDRGEPALSLTGARAHKGALVVRADGIDDKDKADKLKGLKLYVPRAQFAEPEDEDDFYITDLIGLEARDALSAVIGRIKNVDNFGAGDLLDIQPKSGTSFYLSFTRENVPEVSITGGYVVINLPPETQAEPSEKT